MFLLRRPKPPTLRRPREVLGGDVTAHIICMIIPVKDFQVKTPVLAGILCQRAPVGYRRNTTIARGLICQKPGSCPHRRPDVSVTDPPGAADHGPRRHPHDHRLWHRLCALQRACFCQPIAAPVTPFQGSIAANGCSQGLGPLPMIVLPVMAIARWPWSSLNRPLLVGVSQMPSRRPFS